jgi:hypothetical protein
MFMGISPGSKSNAGNAAATASSQPDSIKILHFILRGRILRRLAIVATLLVGLVCWSGFAAAQEERPQIIPGERKVAGKKEVGPRAVGVLQMTGSGKVTLVPIAILINGKFWDATEYKADPVPMALEPGTVYEGERTGSSLGLFTVNNALHSRAVNVLSPWIATGKWTPVGSEPAKTTLKADTVPVGIDSSDAPPRLTRDPAKAKAPASTPGTSVPSTPSQTTPSQTTGTSGSGDEPPRLKRSDPAPASSPSGGSAPSGQTESGTGSPAPAAPGGAKTGESKGTDAKAGDAKSVDHSNVATSDSGADESNRPRLRRGKPVEPLPEDEVPGYSKPGAAASSVAAGADAGKAAVADKGPVDTVPAISDASGPQPKSFTFEWLKDEEGERRQQVVALAKDQVRAYVEAQARARIAPKPAGRAGLRQSSSAKTTANAAAKTGAKTKDPILENEQMKTFDVWTTNQPVIVYSAEAHMPPPAAGSPHSDVDAELRYSILLVVYPDIYNNLHKIYAGVTDKYHLDLTPRLELIDALDADGDGRGELLFREITDGGTGWVIYRPTADKLWKMFDSLKPE